MKAKGGCLCGAVRYEIKKLTREGYFCHCRMCQLAFGNTHASWINVKQENLRWTEKQPKFFRSSKFARRGFCGRCGTPLTFAFNGSAFMDISIGSLDQPGKTRPASHFAIETRVKSWFPRDKLPKVSIKTHKTLAEKWKTYYPQQEPGAKTARTKISARRRKTKSV